MVSQILDKFPTLRGGLDLNDGQVMVKRLLRDKFRNKRAAQKRRLSPEARMSLPPPTKQQRVAGLPNYCPAGGLEGVALQRKVNDLANATSPEEVAKLMDETFEGRRRMMVKGSAADVLVDFPQLFSDDGFRREMDRMAGEENFVSKKVAAASERFVALGRSLRCPSRELAVKQTMKLLGADHDEFFDDGSGGAAAAGGLRISGRGVAFGTTTVVTVPTDVELLVCFVLAHSLLNLYFTKNKPFMTYVQKYILDIDDGCPVPQKTLRFHMQTAM